MELSNPSCKEISLSLKSGGQKQGLVLAVRQHAATADPNLGHCLYGCQYKKKMIISGIVWGSLARSVSTIRDCQSGLCSCS
eukprot:scaffold70996_cov19-Tisochrysis_lutea.AAC.1